MNSSKDARGLLKNISAMSVIHICNYIFPLVLIPYLSRVLGVEMYGVVALGLGMVQIACIITDYGFNLSATYTIANAHGDKQKINETISAVFLCKLMLLLVVFCIFVFFLLFDDKHKNFHFFFLLMLLPIIGQTFQSAWFFLGIEKLKYIYIITSLSRTAYLIFTIVLVKTVDDYLWVAITNGLSQIFIASVELFLLLKMGFGFTYVSQKSIKSVFSDSTPFFWANAASALYNAGGTVFLGFFSTPYQTGIYSAAEQLYRGAIALLTPIYQALYPYMVRTKNKKLFWNVFKLALCIVFLGVFFSSFLVDWVIKLIFGADFSDSADVMMIFMAIFLCAVASGLIGYPYLAAMGDSKSVNMSILYAGFFQIGLLVLSCIFNVVNALQMVLCIFIVEMFILIYRTLAIRKLN
ncbi:oligosaccharide flippase family protein [Pectobacterium versatile]|uniref:oligosaccharide flippase family protein n=1 Tax=Pectobacterium versatile TaxID=2488639 RepID=UPI00200B518F|nr:oligosaccharide flippase family protein [Pectobacterium versatile]